MGAALAAIFVNVEPASWLSMPPGTFRSLGPDALLYMAGLVIVTAPLAGVAVVARHVSASARGAIASPAASIVLPLCVAVALCVATSALITLAAGGGSDGPAWTLLATSHATLGAVALALAAFGVLCATAFHDPLDAAACSLLIVMVATGGLLVAGASVADAPRALIDVALTASPLVTIAAAAHIDIVRMGVPYQISPLAHIELEYPAWYTASAWYVAVAAACFAAATWRRSEWTPRWPQRSHVKLQS